MKYRKLRSSEIQIVTRTVLTWHLTSTSITAFSAKLSDEDLSRGEILLSANLPTYNASCPQ